MNNYKKLNSQKTGGVTLIELSIVLVIIGLIAGGVLVGRNLIRTAELHGVIKDVQEYHMAIEIFTEKYNGMPGDHPRISEIFPGTINGNNDGIVGDGTLDDDLAEAYQAWQHLAKAEMIGGTYSGKRENKYYLFGVNAPESGIYGTQGIAGYTFDYIDELAFPYAPSTNTITLGWAGTFSNTPSGGGSTLSGIDAQFIDAKIDDGRMTSGNVLGENGHDNDMEYLGCAANNASVISYTPINPLEYELQTGKVACTMYFNY